MTFKTNFSIANAQNGDLSTIYSLFDAAIHYQRTRGYPVWKDFDKQAIIDDIKAGNQYKVESDDHIAMVFSVCYADPLIWGERETGDAIYLHRVVVNPSFKGQRLFSQVMTWALKHSNEKKLKAIRMDTWFENTIIIEYYKSFGFQFVDSCTTPDSPLLASQNRNLRVALLQYKTDV